MKLPGGLDINSMMQQAQKMQEEMGRQMKEMTVDASAGGGAVAVVTVTVGVPDPYKACPCVVAAAAMAFIVAWEIDGLLVELSDRKKQGFSRLEIETTGLHYAYEKMKEMFGMGVFYKAKMSVKNIRSILQSLADNPKVKLFLYTTLDLKVAQLILEKLCLLNFFGVENRRSCSDRYSEPMKHPT